jgi:hypothetical protein
MVENCVQCLETWQNRDESSARRAFSRGGEHMCYGGNLAESMLGCRGMIR